MPTRLLILINLEKILSGSIELLHHSTTMPLFTLGQESITLLWLIQVFGLLIIVTLLARSLKRFLKNFLLLKLKINEGNREVISLLVGLGLGILGFILVLKAMGIQLASFAVIIGGLGVGIGFGLQELTKNLVSGLTILGEGKLKVGDLIEFNNKAGYIREISIRSTVIQTFRGSDLVVPNTELTSVTVENWNYDNCQGRIEIPITVAYESDPVLVTETLLESAFMEKNVLRNPPPKVMFKGFGEHALEFELWIWVEKIYQRLSILSSLNFIIQYNFQQRGIEIPFPRRDIWLRNTQAIAPETNDLRIREESPETIQLASRTNNPTLKQLLKELPYFANTNDLDLRQVIEMGERKRLNTGEILVKQGEYFRFFCVVLRGNVDAIYENDKISNRLFVFESGDYFGELPLMLDIPYPTTMRTSEPSLLFLIPPECFHELLHQYPHLADHVAEALAERQDVLNCHKQKLKELGLCNDNNFNHPIIWIRQRLSQIFGLIQSES